MADELPEDFEINVEHVPYGKNGHIAYSITNRTGTVVDRGVAVDGEPRTQTDQTYNVPPQVEEKLRAQIKQVQGEADKRVKDTLEARREAGPITTTEKVSIAHDEINQGAKEANDGAAEAVKPKPPSSPTATSGYAQADATADTRTRRRAEATGG